MRRKICWWLKCKGCWFRLWSVGEVRKVFLHDVWTARTVQWCCKRREPRESYIDKRWQEETWRGLEPGRSLYIAACNGYRSLTRTHQQCGSSSLNNAGKVTQMRQMGTSQNHEPLTRWFNDVQCLNSEGSLWKIVASSGFKAHPSCRDACSRRHAQAGCGSAYALSMLIGFIGSVWDIVVIL